jgi:hypothetical protein
MTFLWVIRKIHIPLATRNHNIQTMDNNDTDAPAASLTTTTAPTSSPIAAATTSTNDPTAAPILGGGDTDTTTAPAFNGPTAAPLFDPTGGNDAPAPGKTNPTVAPFDGITPTNQTDGLPSNIKNGEGVNFLWPVLLLIVFVVSLAMLLASIVNFDVRYKKYNARIRNRLIGAILLLAVLLSIATHASCDMWSLLNNNDDINAANTTTTMSSIKSMDDEWHDIQAIGIWGVWNDTASCQYDGNGYLDSRPHTTTARVMAVFATLAGSIAFMTYMVAQHDTKPKFLAAVSVVAAIFAIGCQAGAITALFRALPCRENNNDEDNDLYDCTMWGSYKTATLGGIWPILSLTYWSTGAAVILYTIVRFDDDAIRPTDE